MKDRHFFACAVVFYGLSMIYSVFLWRHGFRRDNHVNYVLLLLAFGLHTAVLGQEHPRGAHGAGDRVEGGGAGVRRRGHRVTILRSGSARAGPALRSAPRRAQVRAR